MSESELGDPEQQPSPSQEHIDVWRSIDNEDRDPRLIQVQQLWVFLEQHKREKAEGDTRTADEMLRTAKTHYDAVAAKNPHFPPDLRTRLDNLKRELDELLRCYTVTATPLISTFRLLADHALFGS
jgi:hypothetical protein